MKKLVLLLAFSMMILLTYAQKPQRGIIFLKNGSEIKGRILPSEEGKTIIRSAGNIWVFDNSEISQDKIIWQQVELTEPRKWFLETTGGILAGGSDNTKSSPFSFDASFNYHALSKIYAGVGVGVDFLDESYLPVFAKVEYRFRDTRFTPVAGFKGGYMFPLDGNVQTYIYPYYSYDYYYPWYSSGDLNNKGGIVINPYFGFVSMFDNNLGVSLTFGYRYGRASFDGENHYGIETNYNRLSVKLGIIFN